MSNGVQLLDGLQEVVEASVHNLLIGSVAIHHVPPWQHCHCPDCEAFSNTEYPLPDGLWRTIADAWTWSGSPWRTLTEQPNRASGRPSRSSPKRWREHGQRR